MRTTNSETNFDTSRTHTVPSDRRYVKSHEWAKLDGEVATVGISHHAQEELGDIVHAELPEVGSDATAGQPAAAIESVKAAADIYAPITGEVVEINDMLEGEPDLINKRPHEDGWLFKVKVADPATVDTLMSSEEYEATLDKK